MSGHGIFSSLTRASKERRTGKIRGALPGVHRALDEWMLARAPASPAQGLHHHAMDLGISFPLIYVHV